MKKRKLVVIAGIILTIVLTAGCSKENTDAEENGRQKEEAREENLTFGRVTAVGEDSVTIEIAERNESEPPQQKREGQTDTEETENTEETDGIGGSTASETTEAGGEQGEQPQAMDPEEMFTFSGEEQEITVGSDTKITRGGMMGRPGQGKKLEQGEKPDGEAGTAPDLENGKASDTESGEAPAQPADGAEKPEQGEKPDGDAPQMDSEEITLSDIQEGDIVSIRMGDDGTVEEISVMTGGNDEADTDTETE